MKKLKGILLAGLAVGILAGGAATVVSADSYKQATRIQAATVTLSDAKAIALQTAGSGKVVSIDLDGNKAGAVYYEYWTALQKKSTRLMLEQEAFSKPRKSQLMTMRTCN